MKKPRSVAEVNLKESKMFKSSGIFDGNPQQWSRFSIKYSTDAKADGGYFLFLSDSEDTSAPVALINVGKKCAK